MPNRLRRHGLTRLQSGRTVRTLCLAILNLMPAIKQTSRHHVEGLEILPDQMEDLLQVRKHAASELVDQEHTVGMKHRVSFSEDCFSQVGRHGGIRNPGQHVVRMVETQSVQGRIRVRRRPVDHVDPIILKAATEKVDEVGIGLQRNNDGVGSHSPDNFRRKRPDPGTILEKHSSSAPIDLGQHLVDEEA